MSGATDAGDVVTVAYLLTIVSFPIRAIGWLLGEFPRSVVGFRRAEAVLDATGSMEYGAATSAGDRDRRPPRASTTSPTPTTPRQPLLCGRHLRRRARSHGRRGRRDRVGQEHPHQPADPPGRPRRRPRSRSTAPTCATSRRGALAGAVALVPQTAFLFDDTVRGNVTLGADIPDDEVWAALRDAQADGFVAALRDGLDTRLGERGTSLSGGQRQRISLARALVRRPRLLILDDATSAVDPEVEARILASLRAGVERHHAGRRRLPQGDHRARRRGAPPRRRRASPTAAPTPSCSTAARPTPAWSTPTSRPPHEEAEVHDHHGRPPDQRHPDGLRRGHRRDGHASVGAWRSRPSCARASASPSCSRWWRRVVRSSCPIAVQQTLDRGLNGPDGPRLSYVVWLGLAAALAIVVTSLASYAMTTRLFTTSERGLATLADQGLPPRARPAAADAEHRAPRCAGLARHQRRRPGQPVPGLRWADLRGQRRADAGGHRDHGDLQLAAGARRVAVLRAAVRLDPLLPAQALRRPTASSGTRSGVLLGAISRARRRRRGRAVVRRRGPHPGPHRHRHRRLQGRQHPRTEVHRRLLLPGRDLGRAGQRRRADRGRAARLHHRHDRRQGAGLRVPGHAVRRAGPDGHPDPHRRAERDRRAGDG